MSSKNAKAYFSGDVAGVIYFDKVLGGTMVTAHLSGLSGDGAFYICIYGEKPFCFPLMCAGGHAVSRFFSDSFLPYELAEKTVVIYETGRGLFDKPLTDEDTQIAHSLIAV